MIVWSPILLCILLITGAVLFSYVYASFITSRNSCVECEKTFLPHGWWHWPWAVSYEDWNVCRNCRIVKELER